MSFILHNNKNNFKNDILVLAVVGATFAYFTATTKTSGEGSSAEVTTSKLDGATLKFENTGEVLNMLQYPGGLGIYGATATIEKQQTLDANNYKTSFDLQIKYKNETGTDLEWELWVLKKKISDLSIAEEGFDSITTCERKEQVVGGNTYYWYADVEDEGTDYQSQEQCDAEAIKSAVKGESGELIAYGTFPTGKEGEQTITKSSTDKDESGIKYNEQEESQQDEDKKKIKANQLGNRTLDTREGESSKVYYLVVKYPNKNDDQASTDQGRQITVKLEVAGDPVSVACTDQDCAQPELSTAE